MWGTFTRWIIILTILLVVMILIDLATGHGTFAAALRVAWGALAASAAALLGFVKGAVPLILRRRFVKLGGALGAIGLGYGASIVLNTTSVRKTHSLRTRFQKWRKLKKAQWQALSTPAKLSVVAVLIGAQILLIPAIAKYIVFFPIGFLIPLFRRAGMMVTDSALAKVYWRLFEKPHRATVRYLRALPYTSHVLGSIRIARLQYLTAWRLWKYDPQYRKEDGELRRSLLEPFRLMRKGVLKTHYTSHIRLLSGSTKPSRTHSKTAPS